MELPCRKPRQTNGIRTERREGRLHLGGHVNVAPKRLDGFSSQVELGLMGGRGAALGWDGQIQNHQRSKRSKIALFYYVQTVFKQTTHSENCRFWLFLEAPEEYKLEPLGVSSFPREGSEREKNLLIPWGLASLICSHTPLLALHPDSSFSGPGGGLSLADVNQSLDLHLSLLQRFNTGLPLRWVKTLIDIDLIPNLFRGILIVILLISGHSLLVFPVVLHHVAYVVYEVPRQRISFLFWEAGFYLQVIQHIGLPQNLLRPSL